MTDISRDVQVHISAARTTLEAVVGAGKQFTPMIAVVRGGVLIAYITPPSGDGQMIYRIAQLAADGYEADEIILLTDVYAASEPINPYTLKPWKRGEMEELAVRHRGVERGWVRDALMLLFVKRVGDPMMITMPYAVADGVLTWLDKEATRRDSGDTYLAAGLLTRVFEPSGLFQEGEERPDGSVFERFLIELGATVLGGTTCV